MPIGIYKHKPHSEKTKKKMSDKKKGKIPKNIELLKQKAVKFKIGHIPWNKGKRLDYMIGNKYGFKKDQPPWNKNTKGIMKPNKTSFKKGEKHQYFNNWKSFEPYNKSFNNKFKRAIRKRDNQICMLCLIHREKLNRVLDVHHVDYDKLLSIPQNCISLCRSCHSKTNFNRKHWISFFQSLLGKLYDYQYENKKIVVGVESG